ncbi:MAG: O-sialoglycoprotein endopeptidase, partial [Firmicutes bacterium]|nr:O-sialoglycoprotein endopeptidase [Bacillota bacterium]
MGELILGIDTSNYRTSVALVNDRGEIIYNHRELLEVPEGKKGLRQSEAFFQHVMRLPDALEPALEYRDSITGIACSSRPRPREGSYMPCFMAGETVARELASALNVPLREFSHQEGHIEAVKYFSALRDTDDVVFFHFSGGTTEAVYRDEIVGGTLDIAFGQVLDRIGQKMGLSFPSGEELDRMTVGAEGETAVLKPVTFRDGYLNL